MHFIQIKDQLKMFNSHPPQPTATLMLFILLYRLWSDCTCGRRRKVEEEECKNNMKNKKKKQIGMTTQ